MKLTNEDRAILSRLPIQAQAEYRFADCMAHECTRSDLICFGSVVTAVAEGERLARSRELGRPA